MDLQFFGSRGSKSGKRVKKETETKVKYPVSEKGFDDAFKKLEVREPGRIFYKIPDLRKELGWSREKTDNMLKQVRDNGRYSLRVGDASLMTRKEIEDCFYDENGFRMGTITRNNR